MTGGHAVQEQQATTVVAFCMGRANAILLCKSAIEKQTLSSPYVTVYHLYSWILQSTALYNVLFLFIINMRSAFCGGEGNHTYSLVGQSMDKKKLRRRLLRCIHNHLVFDDMAARRSTTDRAALTEGG